MKNRRTFLTLTSLTAANIAAGAPPAPAPERQVISLISSYGHATRISRTRANVNIRARIDCFQTFAQTYTGSNRHPVTTVHAAGNRLSFTLDGIGFQIDHVA